MNRKKLVLLPNIADLSREEVKIVCNAEWYEANGILLADAQEINYLSEASPEDAGIDIEKVLLSCIPRCLKRFSEEDGFYHA